MLQLMKKIMMLAVAILMLTGNVTFAQTEVNVAPGLNTINAAVAANPGATLILAKGGQYVLDESVHITVPTIIKGEEYTLDDTDGPAVINMVADPGLAGDFQLFVTAADLTLENLGFIGYTPSDEQIFGVVSVDKDGLAVTIINCVVQGVMWFMDSNEHNSGIYLYHDNIFFNMCTEISDNHGGYTGPQYKGDSIEFTAYNNTYFEGGRAHGSTSKGVMGIQDFDHNTYVNSWGETYYKNYGYQLTFTNNIYFNTHIRGYVGERLKADTVYYGGDHISYDDFGDTLNGEVMSFINRLDTVDVAGLERIFTVTNNLKFNEQRVLDWNDAHGVTAFPFVTPSNWGFADTYGWTIENNWIPDDTTDYDPEFAMGALPDAMFDPIWLQSEERRLAQADRSEGYPHPIAWYPGGEAKGEFIWPLPFDVTPTAEALMTAGSDGYPLGDLNWFGPEMVAAWEAGHALGLKENKSVELSLMNYPNPFSSNTRIKYNLSATSHVTMKIYNMTGSEVATLVNENQIPGQHEIEFDGANLSGGMYFCWIKAGNIIQVHKMTMIK